MKSIALYGRGADAVKLATLPEPVAAAGHLKPVIDQVFAFDRALEAPERMAGNQKFGKYILSFQ